MTITSRSYSVKAGFHLVSDFLASTYVQGGKYPNWEESRWQYMHSHPWFDPSVVDKIRIWEDSGKVVGVATHEGRVGQAFIHSHPDYTFLKPEMAEYADQHLYKVTEQGKGRLVFYVREFDTELERIVADLGYAKDEAKPDWTSIFEIPEVFPEITLPEGYGLQSLADENDLHKINRVMYRGFNHPGEPPEEDVESRRQMQTSPNFRHDLTIVVKAPNGDYAAFCGMWFEPVTKLAYVEPVCTDPTYRRIGLGKAAVLEGIRRCVELGATHAMVGSGQDFYLSFGFKKTFATYPWVKEFDL